MIQLEGLVTGDVTSYNGKYVVSYDPMAWRHQFVASIEEVEALIGEFVTVTDDIEQARRFGSMVEATEFWRQEGAGVRPWDGKPNRPLTAFHITILPVDEPAGSFDKVQQ